MGSALHSFPVALSLTAKNPKLWVLSFLATVLALVFGLFAGLIPIFGNFIAAPVIGVLFAGVLGSAFIAIRDDTAVTFGAYFDTLERTWLSVAAAFFLLAVIQFAAVFGLIFVALFAGVGFAFVADIGAEPGSSAGALSGIGVVVAVLFALTLVAILLAVAILQFVDVAIVAGGHDVAGAFGEAWALFKTGPASVVGYSLLRGFVFVVGFAVPVVVVTAMTWAGVESGSTLFAGALVGLVAVPVSYAAGYAYHAAYYVERRPGVLRPDA